MSDFVAAQGREYFATASGAEVRVVVSRVWT